MAQFITTIRTDLDRPLGQYTIGGKMFTQDNKANRINVELYKKNVKVDASGEITGIVKRNDGKAVAFAGSIENGNAYVVLPETAYAIEGPIDILVRETIDDAKTVIAVCKAYVTKSADADYVTAGSTVVSIEELVAALDELDPLIERMQAVDVDKLSDITSKLEEVDEKLGAWNETEATLNEIVTDFEEAREEANNWFATKVNRPTTNPNGTSGQVLRTKGNGETEWVDAGLPTNSQTSDAVSSWLANHPDITTNVEDGSITPDKMSESAKSILRTAVQVEVYRGTLYIDPIFFYDSVDIIMQPTNVTANIGDTVSFTTSAKGFDSTNGTWSDSDVTYSWQYLDSTDDTWKSISGATSGTYSFTVSSDSPSTYRCIITNGINGDWKATNIVYRN